MKLIVSCLPKGLRLLALASSTLIAALSSNATILSYTVSLDGPSESPANASPATGFGTLDYDNLAHTMSLQFSWTGLTGTTTASHIHAATTTPFSGTAGVATTTPYFSGFPIGVTSGSYSNTLDLTQASSYNPAYVTANGGTTTTAEAALMGAIAGGKAYLNIHSSTFGGGEIRGFFVAVPEPGTLSLAALGGLALLLKKRRS